MYKINFDHIDKIYNKNYYLIKFNPDNDNITIFAESDKHRELSNILNKLIDKELYKVISLNELITYSSKIKSLLKRDKFQTKYME